MQLLKLVENSFGLKRIVFMIFDKLPLEPGDTFTLNQVLLVKKIIN